MARDTERGREARAAARKALEGYRAAKTLQAQTARLIAATVERIQREEALLAGVSTPSAREALLGLMDAEEAHVAQLQGYADDYAGRMAMVEGVLEGGGLTAVHSELLRLHYLERNPWVKIARHLGYSADYTRGTLHARALEAFASAAGLDC